MLPQPVPLFTLTSNAVTFELHWNVASGNTVTSLITPFTTLLHSICSVPVKSGDVVILVVASVAIGAAKFT